MRCCQTSKIFRKTFVRFLLKVERFFEYFDEEQKELIQVIKMLGGKVRKFN